MIEDVLVKVKYLIFPADFIVMDIEEDSDIPLILGCPFMSTASLMVDMGKKMLQMGIEDQKISFDLFHEDKDPPNRNVCLKVHVMKERKSEKKMASKKRKAPATPSQVSYDRSRFTSLEAWEKELERRNWHEELTSFAEGSIDVAIVKEFYANLYDPEDKSPKQEGETPSAYSEFALLRLDPQELVAKLCIPGRGFELNVDGLPLKILKKNLTTIAQTWSLLSFSNLVPTSHPSDITLDRAKLIYGIIQRMDMNVGYLISHQISMIAHHDSSRLGFPALITALCKAKGVTFDSRTLESLSPAINLAYEKKNYWNLDDLTVTFRGPRKAKGKKSETLPSYKVPPTTSAPASSTPATSTPSKVDISFHDIHFI
ncbi:hypothetical protein D0Y65_006356 [Glycine soja]|uniref:Putative plant transposon protein domain-containing protein n=1 Tax=Glycine soja TaxID=3848 RepID=A0A445L8B7_GLYSO|nr:hypothetical protein D0Y65_006356 [Glycine soja]